MEASITLNRDEQKRLIVLNAVLAGHSTGAEAAASLGLSLRQVRRVLAAYRKEGAAALAHGNRGRRPVHTTSSAVAEQVVSLAQTTYAGCNQQHLRDLLAEREGIGLSRATVHRLLEHAGLLPPPSRRPPQHRRRRTRRSQAGQLVQIDGSRHAWLEERGPWLTLVAAIDDATGRLEAAVFREQEDAQGYLLLVWQVVERCGRPLALYHDRHGIFLPTLKAAAPLSDELAGRPRPQTQVARALEELGIASVVAHSPQAKGRVERLFATLQDRLVRELRLSGVSSLAGANRFLDSYLPRFNARFAVPAQVAGSAYRPLEPGQRLEAICCFKYGRVVAADNTVTFGPHRLQLQPSATRRSFAQARVEVQERLDGRLAVCYHGQVIRTTPAPAEAPQLRARRGPLRPATALAAVASPDADQVAGRSGHRRDRQEQVQAGARSGPPAPTHPWRRPLTPKGASRGQSH
jgi:transposase